MNSDNLRILNALKAIADKLGADDKSNVSENEVGKIAEELERIAMIGDLKPEPGSGGGSSLSELSDTAITSPSDNDVLTYDSDSGKWKNAAGGSGGGFLKVMIQYDDVKEMSVLDKTWQEIYDALDEGWYVAAMVEPNEPDSEYAGQMPIWDASIDTSVQLGKRYRIDVSNHGETISFYATSSDGYPEADY